MTMKNDVKFLRGINVPFQNWHEEFGKFSQAEKLQYHFRKQPDQPGAVRKLYFNLEINE